MWSYLGLINHFALCSASMFGILFLDDDLTSVSLREWLLFAVLLYSVAAFARNYRAYVEEQGDGLN